MTEEEKIRELNNIIHDMAGAFSRLDCAVQVATSSGTTITLERERLGARVKFDRAMARAGERSLRAGA